VKSVRAVTGIWDKSRPTEGAYNAFLTFENGVSATMTYSGHAHFDSDELLDWTNELGLKKDPKNYGAARRAILEQGDLAREKALKNARNYGGSAYTDLSDTPARQHQTFGFLLASCERADLRAFGNGVRVYGDLAQEFMALEPPKIPRSEVVDELVAAVFDHIAPLHSGEWSLATMEVCLALLQSAREGREIMMQHQVSAP
jgi:phthalate 4,5-cis-dihydrodiol dehydrogenase